MSLYKRFRFSSAHKLTVLVSRNMSGIVEMTFPLLKPNMQPPFPTAAFYPEMLGVKKAKLDDVKGLFKYLGQTLIDFINSITEKVEEGEDTSVVATDGKFTPEDLWHVCRIVLAKIQTLMTI